MPRLDPPFRAEHIGSLLRPPALFAAREDHAACMVGTSLPAGRPVATSVEKGRGDHQAAGSRRDGSCVILEGAARRCSSVV